MKLRKLLLLFLSISLIYSCDQDGSQNEVKALESDSLVVEPTVSLGEVEIIEPVQDDEVLVLRKNGIVLTEIKTENNREATIDLNTKIFNEGNNQLSFSVSDIQQYSIAYLANNYSLSYFKSDVFDVDFLFGNNVFCAFLTDKNNISIKTNRGSVLKNVILGGAENLFDMDQAHLFYYLPQSKTNEVILDFYLVNTTIGKTQNRVKVIINETVFILDKWAAYRVSGLDGNENTLRIQLLDKNGVLIDGPFNDSGERTFRIVEKSS